MKQNFDKRFRILTKQKREAKAVDANAEEKKPDPKGKDAKKGKEVEVVDTAPKEEFEYIEKTRWIIDPSSDLEVYIQF